MSLTNSMPSRLPVNITRASYTAMITHGTINHKGTWVCRKEGCRIHARFVQMNIFDRTTGLCTNTSAVATLYCSKCDAVPNTHEGHPVYEDEVVTVAL